MKEPKTMEDLHKIREENYERTKNMSAEEYLAYLDKQAREIMRKYDLNLEVAEPRGVKVARP